MEVITVNQSNFIGLTSQYLPDADVLFNENIYYTEQGINIPLNGLYSNLEDNKTNNYSNLSITQKNNIASQIQLKQLDNITDGGFATYLAVNAIELLTPTTNFWVTQEPPISANTANIAVTGTLTDISNNYFFDIQFIDNNTCKIKHDFESVSRYLTLDMTTDTLIFAKDAQQDSLGVYSPQIFNYVYNRDSDFIIFIKNVNDVIYYVTFNPSTQNLTLTTPVTGTIIPYTTNSIFTCITRNQAPNNTVLYDAWVSYNKNFNNNTQDINNDLSISQVNTNLLLNNQFLSLSGNTYGINILSLKNDNTPENYKSRNNPFTNELDSEFRTYRKLFTGSNQLLGNDNISIGYESFTSRIVLKADTVTYFHIPQVFYPWQQLNINDSGLIEAGAIAGDHPLKSDTIFKKKANFKYTSPYGKPSDELTGDFLCSWLSGSSDPTVKPIWVDRYYNPSKISFVSALTSSNFEAIVYESIFDCLDGQVNEILGNVSVYDKPSDLVFEAGTYYAYNHIGNNEVANYIQTLQPELIQQDFPNFLYFNGTSASDQFNGKEYVFNGETYSYTTGLSAINDTNQLTVAFFAYNSDWTQPFAYQLLGNFSDNGFGIFNKNVVTPTLFLPSISGLQVLNTDFVQLYNIQLKNDINNVIKRDGFLDYHIIYQNGVISKVNNLNVEVNKTAINAAIDVIDFDYNESIAYLLGENTTVNHGLSSYDLQSCELIDISITESPFFNFPSIISTINSATTVDYVSGEYYFTPGIRSQIYGNTIYYSTSSSIIKWEDIDLNNTTTSIAFSSNSVINDFNIDFNSNIWILSNNNTYSQYTLSRNLILSGVTPDNRWINKEIDFVAEFNNDQYVTYPIITQYNAVSANIVQLLKLSTTGEILSTTQFNTTSTSNCRLTNSDFLRKYTNNKYSDPNLNVKATLTNLYNSNDTTTTEIIYNLSALDPGYHHFAVRFDSYQGLMYLFIDGQQVGLDSFTPRKYRFSNLINKPFFIGASVYNSNIPMFKYLKQNLAYFTQNLKIKNFYLYNTPLNYYDLFYHTREGFNIRDIGFDVACGRRNYIEEIERYLKFNVPGSKSTLFNVILRNSGITDSGLQSALEQRILQQLQSSIPAYAKVNTIEWIN